MKYADRAPWDEAMDEMLSAHLGPACEATGLELAFDETQTVDELV